MGGRMGLFGRKSVFDMQLERQTDSIFAPELLTEADTRKAVVCRDRYSKDLAEYINLCDDTSLINEIRHRVLATVRASYWHQFEEGMISEEATKLLVESAEIAMDAKTLCAQWDWIE